MIELVDVTNPYHLLWTVLGFNIFLVLLLAIATRPPRSRK